MPANGVLDAIPERPKAQMVHHLGGERAGDYVLRLHRLEIM
jgi:hypothetical protein